MKKILFICLLFNCSLLCAQNTNLGANAGNGGANNTSIGHNAGNGGSANVSLGTAAGDKIHGSSNVFLGNFAGHNTMSSSYNVMIGYKSGTNSDGSVCNVFCGFNSGLLTTGSWNTFLGTNTGTVNTSGEENTFIGGNAGNENQGSNNTFTGFRSGVLNIANGNSFYGSYSGYLNTEGNQNTFMGYRTGNFNRSGSSNTFIGYYAGFITGGDHNTFLGSNAGSSNESGTSNVYIGSQSGTQNAEGQRNLFIGYEAGQNANGNGNVLIGPGAGRSLTSSDKLFIANNAGKVPLIFGDFASGSIGLGTINPGKYRLFVNGDAYATGLWISSDKRFKKQGKKISSSLEKVLAMDGKSYQLKQEPKYADKNFSEGTHFGFYAQELQKVLPELVREDEDGYLAINYIEIIPVLTEAIKELAHKQELLTLYENRLNQIEQTISDLADQKQIATGNPLLYPDEFSISNHPNPAKHETTIAYRLPEQSENARIMIFDLQGNELYSSNELSGSNGQLSISSNLIGKGLFNYVLIVNNEIVLTRKMIIE
ncbi:MAG: tail fiber domain-containing protein [Bacteroidota bacterium]